jgi:glutathione S-transferase
MLILHHLNNSRSHRIIWLMEELGVEYEIKYYQRDPKTFLAPSSLKTIHPIGSSPVITDESVTLAESGAIIEYILYKYGQNRLIPTIGSTEWVQYLYWLHFAEGTLMPMLFFKLIFENIHYHSPFFIKPITKTIKSKVNNYVISPRLTTQMNFIESTLEKNLWLTSNEFTAADIQMGIPLLWASENKKMINDKPKIMAFIERIKTRPAFIRTLEKGGEISRVTRKK